MNSTAVCKIAGLGVLTGMRSMAGPATLALQHGGIVKHVMGMMAAGEMVADKTDRIGDRIDAVPLAGRAVMGAIVGGIIARQERSNVWLGGVIGASAAVIAAHLAYQARKRLPLSTAVGGVVEDAVVVGLGAWYASQPHPSSYRRPSGRSARAESATLQA